MGCIESIHYCREGSTSVHEVLKQLHLIQFWFVVEEGVGLSTELEVGVMQELFVMWGSQTSVL